jgi:hypothetical protein
MRVLDARCIVLDSLDEFQKPRDLLSAVDRLPDAMLAMSMRRAGLEPAGHEQLANMLGLVNRDGIESDLVALLVAPGTLVVNALRELTPHEAAALEEGDEFGGCGFGMVVQTVAPF